ncbi:MAG: hypothetical protein DMG89_04940 [Acidobacteria bacterium]|nr:MAG: hypothetical protein DMG89_04940 [Acidobacteriota bacterium]
MLKTLDVLIGVTTVLLLFSMAVTVITQAITNIGSRRGRHLRSGLADLLLQLGIPTQEYAQKIADGLLRHPLIAEGKRKLGTVIHREEFTKLLLDFASGTGAQKLEVDAHDALKKALEEGGITDPDQALKNIRAISLQLEASNPELSNHLRDGLAILHEAPSDFVARVNSWFDQTIDRVSQRFTTYTHWITIGVSILVVLAVQLDMIAIADRLWIDDQFRNTIVSEATKQFSEKTQSPQNAANANLDPKPFYNLLNSTALITVPGDNPRGWLQRLKDWRKAPGMILSVLLISLGAPFWYNVLKDLLKLRSSLSQKDDLQRNQRQAASGGSDTRSSALAGDGPRPTWLSGERGDLTAVG